MNKSKKITLFGILSLFSLILLSSTDFYGTATGSAPLNRILQFAGPLTLCSFIMPALLPGNKYFKNILFTGIAYVIWNVFYFVLQNGFTSENFIKSFLLAKQSKYMYIACVALQFLVILPALKWIYKRFPIALLTFALIWTVFFQYSYITGTIIYYRLSIFSYMKLFFHIWLIYPVMCMFIVDKFDKIVSCKHMLTVSAAGFITTEIIVYLESITNDWGWTFIRPSVIFLTFFAAILLCFAINKLSEYKLVKILTNILEHSFTQIFFSFFLFFIIVNSVLQSGGGIVGLIICAVAVILLTSGYGIIITKIKKRLGQESKIHIPQNEADQ